MKMCVHDRAREGCDACDRLHLSQRAAAMLVLGLDASDLDAVERVRELRRIAREDRPAPDGRRAVDRLWSLLRDIAHLGSSHREREHRSGDVRTREHHASSASSWEAEAQLVGGLLELLGHPPSVARKRAGDQT